MSEYLYLYKKQNNHLKKKLIYLISFFVIVGLLFLVFLYSHIFGSQSLELEKQITIPQGFSLNKTAELLVSEGVLNSRISLILLDKQQGISVKAGDYLFSGIQYPREIAQRLNTGAHGDVYIKLTIPEGSTLIQVADIISRSSFEFDKDVFEKETKGLEGYLFPDTYSFLPSTDTSEIVRVLTQTFRNKTDSLQVEIQKSSRSLKDIIIMASLLEKEATGNIEEQKTVAGILWKRLDQGKLLQVDAPFKYIYGEVKASDLRKDGPYNTYTRLGLTPTPIGNPGLASIQAAINPTQSPYYFYLHGKNGNIYYGVTYREHINNINRYLR
ncbi:MAG: UPF0755 protein [Crocinitomicaceae bacterium]|jgi:UPF0755 protein